MLRQFMSRKQHAMPHIRVQAFDALEVEMNELVSTNIPAGESWHGHAGPLIGCTVIGALARLEDSSWLVHLQHYPSGSVDEGIGVFAGSMAKWKEAGSIAMAHVGLLSPAQIVDYPRAGMISVPPLAPHNVDRIKGIAEWVHPDADFRHDTYAILNTRPWREGQRYPGMDIVLSSSGASQMSVYTKPA